MSFTKIGPVLLFALASTIPAFSQSSDGVYMAAMRSCDEYNATKHKKDYDYEQGTVIMVTEPGIKDDDIKMLSLRCKFVIKETYHLGSVKLIYIKVNIGSEDKWIRKLTKEEIISCCYLNAYLKCDTRGISIDTLPGKKSQ